MVRIIGPIMGSHLPRIATGTEGGRLQLTDWYSIRRSKMVTDAVVDVDVGVGVVDMNNILLLFITRRCERKDEGERD